MTMCVRMDPGGQIIPELKKFKDKELLKKLFQKGGYRVVKRGVSCGKKGGIVW